MKSLWFLNSKKFHFMFIVKNGESKQLSFTIKRYENSKEEVILGIAIDNKLDFDSCMKKMLKK